MKVEEAVDEYFQFKFEESKKDLQELIDQMSESYGTKFRAETPEVMGLEFFLARLAIDCHKLWFLFSREIADEIFKLLFSKYLKVNDPTDKQTADKLFGYMDIIDEMQKTKSEVLKRRLLEQFAETFLKRALGQNIENFYVTGFSRKDIVSPLILAHCSSILVRYKISWAAIKDKATIE